MEKRKVSNLLALAVLSLLGERPMHPYELSAVMRQRELSTVIKLNQSSLYSVIETLQKEGWIVTLETQREGRYPERTVYAITEVGRTQLANWLRSLLRMPVTEYTQFAAALAFIGNLTPSEVTTLLEEHAQHLQEQMNTTGSTLERGRQLGVDRLFLVEDEYALTLLQAKFTFLQHLLQEINDGTLTEMRDEKRVWKVTRPDLASLGSENEEGQKNSPDESPQDD